MVLGCVTGDCGVTKLILKILQQQNNNLYNVLFIVSGIIL